MKRTLIIFFFLMPLFSVAQIDSLKGNVKHVKESVIFHDTLFLRSLSFYPEFDFGQYRLREETIFDELNNNYLYDQKIPNTEKYFDYQNRIVKEISVNQFYKYSTTTNFTYDEDNGNLIHEQELTSSGYIYGKSYSYSKGNTYPNYLLSEGDYEVNSDIFHMTQYFYNDKMLVVEKRELSPFGWDQKEYFSYDKDGKILKSIGTSVDKRKLVWNELLGLDIYEDSSYVYYQEKFEYNAEGMLKKKTKGCIPGTITCNIVLYEYDKVKRKVSSIFFLDTLLFSVKKYEYHKDNSLKKILWFYKNQSTSTNFVEYYYNEDKNLNKAIFTDGKQRTIIEFNYRFDDRDNWIEQIKKVNGKIFHSRKREIVYY